MGRGWVFILSIAMVASAVPGAFSISSAAGVLASILPPCLPFEGGAFGDACAFESGEAQGNYYYNVITVPEGVTVEVTGELFLWGRASIVVEGDLLGRMPAGDGRDGSRIHLVSGSILIHGRIVAANGDSGANASADESASAGAGGRGGDVGFSSLGAGVYISPSGLVSAGNGGAGGSAQVIARGDDGLAEVVARGGNGGRGGSIEIFGPLMTSGKLHVGSGGDGGMATAAASVGTPAGLPDGATVARGGRGGDAGDFFSAPAVDVLALAFGGLITGGKGGSGGRAESFSTSWSPNGTNDGHFVELIADPSVVSCAKPPTSASGVAGVPGCDGGASVAIAGAGGRGLLHGGWGGSAVGHGASAGPGGDGGAGEASPDGAIDGGAGGAGGGGGPLHVAGGVGGWGILQGGRGGSAVAHGGNAAKSGNGGAGAVHVFPDDSFVCAYPGSGGPAVLPWGGFAEGGDGAPGILVGGGGGSASVLGGADGRSGSPGDVSWEWMVRCGAMS